MNWLQRGYVCFFNSLGFKIDWSRQLTWYNYFQGEVSHGMQWVPPFPCRRHWNQSCSWFQMTALGCPARSPPVSSTSLPALPLADSSHVPLNPAARQVSTRCQNHWCAGWLPEWLPGWVHISLRHAWTEWQAPPSPSCSVEPLPWPPFQTEAPLSRYISSIMNIWKETQLTDWSYLARRGRNGGKSRSCVVQTIADPLSVKPSRSFWRDGSLVPSAPTCWGQHHRHLDSTNLVGVKPGRVRDLPPRGSGADSGCGILHALCRQGRDKRNSVSWDLPLTRPLRRSMHRDKKGLQWPA